MPPPRVWAEKNPEADRRLKLARAAVTEMASTLAIPLENVLTPESLRRIAWTPPEDVSETGIRDALHALGARPWQLDATAQVIAQAFVEASQSPEPAPDGGS